ncbi:MAG: TetR/AcrR family transcriptional regulator [Ilumatobacter sp.]|nr:TetR/AcrR family transcriptional regulator [Ilumatobacter sp.]
MSTTGARPGRPVDSDGAATRTRILVAARTAFADLGYAATTYRLLAESTGLAHSALYNYFGSKAELYAAVHDEVKAETYAGIEPAIAGTKTFAARIDALLRVFVDSLSEAPEAPRFLAAARIDTARHDELAPIRDALPAQRRSLFAEAVDLGVATGELDREDRDDWLAMLDTMTIGLIEVCSEPDRHRSAVAGFRRTIHALLDAKAAEGLSA